MISLEVGRVYKPQNSLFDEFRFLVGQIKYREEGPRACSVLACARGFSRRHI